MPDLRLRSGRPTGAQPCLRLDVVSIFRTPFKRPRYARPAARVLASLRAAPRAILDNRTPNTLRRNFIRSSELSVDSHLDLREQGIRAKQERPR